jgi:hypothetical protein
MSFDTWARNDPNLYVALFWLSAAAVAFASARWGGIFGALVGLSVVAVAVVALDVRWIFAEMRINPKSGADADGVFALVTLARAGATVLVMLPITIFGLWRFYRGRNKLSNQSSEPTLAPGTTPAGQEPRLP